MTVPRAGGLVSKEAPGPVGSPGQALQHKTPSNRGPETQPLATLSLRGLKPAVFWTQLEDLLSLLSSPFPPSWLRLARPITLPLEFHIYLFYDGGQWPARAGPRSEFSQFRAPRGPLGNPVIS